MHVQNHKLPMVRAPALRTVVLTDRAICSEDVERKHIINTYHKRLEENPEGIRTQEGNPGGVRVHRTVRCQLRPRELTFTSG